MFDLGWLERTVVKRAVRVTPSGRLGLGETLGLDSGVGAVGG